MTEELRMIRDSAQAIVPAADLSRIRGLRFTQPGWDRSTWSEICALGWPALRLPEDKGGIGLDMPSYCVLAEELGRGLVPEPLIDASLAAALLDGDDLADQLEGDRLILPAWQECRDTIAPETRITGATITTRKVHVPAGADAFLVLGPDNALLVDAHAKGVTIQTHQTQDGAAHTTVTFDSAKGRPIDAEPTNALAEATLATAAYLLGLIDAALDVTVAYLRTRTQFGKTIGSFQILQHMAVDLKLDCILTRASIEDAARRWTGPTPTNLAAVSRAKARAAQSAMKVTRDCIQLHGGIGFTDEHDIGLYLRKALVIAPRFGSAKAHRARFADLTLIAEEA